MGGRIGRGIGGTRSMRYFFYGTLLDADVRRAVLGSVAIGSPSQPARLEGFRLAGLSGTPYPVIVAGEGHVEGRVFTLATPRARERLRSFEGGAYIESVQCVCGASGEMLRARLFMPRHALRSNGEWSFERWRRIDKRRLLRALARNPSMRAAR
jgi:gamma-glutamylcyclotransferase (GGCT)/AIG2-like uncharacterized protein YtfP